MNLESLSKLRELVYNLWWTWYPRARNFFRNLNPILWDEVGGNPVKLFQRTDLLMEVLKQPNFLNELEYIYGIFKYYLNTHGLYYKKVETPIAFFSAEYGLHHTLHFYAGGLGLLAGDILKEASDLDFPLIGIGFMYPQGYVHQKITESGEQIDIYSHIPKTEIPVEKVYDKNGDWLKIYSYCCNEKIYAGVWQVSVGRVKLYLLDTDVEENPPYFRVISSQLYTSDLDLRLKQQIILGFGGIELLKKLNIPVYSCGVHINEDYPAMALVARLVYFWEETKNFEEAISLVRKTSLFTTHTPLKVAVNTYPFDLIEKQLCFLWEIYGIDKESFLNLGINPQNLSEGFNTTILAMRLSEYINAVSKKHQEVAKKQWAFLWPERKIEDVPIDYVTNGVHFTTWIDEDLWTFLNNYFRTRWVDTHDNEAFWNLIDRIPDEELWKIHYRNKEELIHFIRDRIRKRWKEGDFSSSLVIAEGALLDPDVLTIGFARRITGYKRPALIFHNLERLKRIVNDPERPVQIIFAGKAHPQDKEGKELIKKIVNHAQDPDFAGRIVFIENYDQELAYYLVKGVDVWLNNPLPPLEACGTSGMKAGINGVIPLSILDGWWIEGYNGKNGWAFGDYEVEGDRNPKDAEAIYEILEEEIIPLFYTWDERGIPLYWVKLMKETIKSIAPRFCARRMLKEYISKFYIPIDKACQETKRILKMKKPPIV